MNIFNFLKPAPEFEGDIIQLSPAELLDDRTTVEKFSDTVSSSLNLYLSQKSTLEFEIATATEKLRQIDICIAGLSAARDVVK